MDKFEDGIDGFLRGSLLFSDDVSALFGDLSGKRGIGKAFLGHLQQLLRIFDLDCPFNFQQILNGLFEVKGVRAKEGAFAECGRFHHIGTAHGSQSPSDKDD